MEKDPRQQSAGADDDNEIGFRKADEDAQYDEAGSQGPTPGEPPADEESDGD
jgi:hypothetical protein